MNKETFTSELVCLLDVASRPQDIADFKAEVESFFIAGAARIDLIGKVMDLDNDLGGYLFDIPLLEETENAIAEAGEQPGRKSTIVGCRIYHKVQQLHHKYWSLLAVMIDHIGRSLIMSAILNLLIIINYRTFYSQLGKRKIERDWHIQ